jgi:hypothetical protein
MFFTLCAVCDVYVSMPCCFSTSAAFAVMRAPCDAEDALNAENLFTDYNLVVKCMQNRLQQLYPNDYNFHPLSWRFPAEVAAFKKSAR